MKAVIYHADSHFAWGRVPQEGLYEKLFRGAVENFKSFGVESVIHLTLPGFPGWGDENIVYEGLDPHNVVYNREVTFAKFLASRDDATEYWFTEPDCRIKARFDGLGDFDAAFLFRREDNVPMCPAWRLATRKALPIFEEIVELFDDPRKDWHGDSDTFTKMWRRMTSPKSKTVYKGIRVQMRPYEQYVKGPGPKFCTNALGPNGKKGVL